MIVALLDDAGDGLIVMLPPWLDRNRADGMADNQNQQYLPVNRQVPLQAAVIDRNIDRNNGGGDAPPNCSLGTGRRRDPSEESYSSSGKDSPQESDEFHFVEESHSHQVLLGLNSLRLGKILCDVVICVDDEEFSCHKIVLSSFSPYFKAMFAGELSESQQDRVVLNGVEASMIKQLIDYAYTSEITITKTNVQSLLSASNLLDILQVRDACCIFMESHMDETNCLGLHCFAETHACTELQDKAKEYTLRYFSDVIKQDEFLHLPPNKLIEFICSDNLGVSSEEHVFEGVVMWYNYNPDQRGQNFDKVLEQVRLPLLSPYFIYDCVQTLPIIRQCPACRDLVEEAKIYHLLPDRRGELRSSRTRHRNSSGTTEVIVAVGGEDDKVVLRSVESFDPHTLQWRTLACLPFAISKHGLVVSGNNMLYMAGGEFPDGSASRSVFKYDPIFDVWQEMAPMSISRSELGLAMLDGYIYAVGGWEGSYRLDSVERYDPQSNCWEFVSHMKMALTSPAVVSFNGRLFVMGGAVLEDGDGIEMVQCYNSKQNCWTEVAPTLIARSGSAACVLNNLIYVIGGWHASTENTSKVECYDPVKNEWQFRASMNERRYRPGVAVVNGKIYVCGGEEGWDRYHDTIECYDEATDVWEIVGEMPTSRSWLSCVVLQMNKDKQRDKTVPSLNLLAK